MPRTKTKIILGIFVFIFFIFCQRVEAKEIDTLFLDKETVQRGYTVVSSDHQFKLGILPGAVKEEISVTIQSPANHPSFPKDAKAVSAVYQFDLERDESFSLNYPLDLSLEYQSSNLAPKAIYYFDQNKDGWVALTSSVSHTTNSIQGKISLPYAQVVVLEQTAFRVTLDKDTLNKGFTVSNPKNQDFKIGIFPKTINQETVVVLKPVLGDEMDVPDGLEAVSDCYSFELKTKNPLRFQRPIVLSIKINQLDDYDKQIYFYDRNKKTWLPLPSQTVNSEREVRAFIHLPYAKVMVLKNSQIMEEGQASWYRSSENPLGAASNDHPYDSRLKVTNLANEKSVEVMIVSTGPFVPGRIIDLAHGAFQSIANLYQDGVIWVRVERV